MFRLTRPNLHTSQLNSTCVWAISAQLVSGQTRLNLCLRWLDLTWVWDILASPRFGLTRLYLGLGYAAWFETELTRVTWVCANTSQLRFRSTQLVLSLSRLNTTLVKTDSNDLDSGRLNLTWTLGDSSWTVAWADWTQPLFMPTRIYHSLRQLNSAWVQANSIWPRLELGLSWLGLLGPRSSQLDLSLGWLYLTWV